MKISELKTKALSSLEGNWGVAVGLTFIYFMLNTVLVSVVETTVSGAFGVWSDTKTMMVTAKLSNLAISMMLIPFYVGVYWFYLDMVRGKGPKIGDAFLTYNDFYSTLKLLGASIMQFVYTFLWSLLLVIPGVIKSIAYSQMFYLLRDHPEYSINEAITESRKRMNGLKTKYFLLILSFIGWSFLAMFTMGIGFLWLVPYFTATMATFYNENIADESTNLEAEAN